MNSEILPILQQKQISKAIQCSVTVSKGIFLLQRPWAQNMNFATSKPSNFYDRASHDMQFLFLTKMHRIDG